MDNKQNFSFTTSIATPIEYYKVLVLQRLNDLNEAWEMYTKDKYVGKPIELNIIIARTTSLFNALAPYLERKLPPESIEFIQKTLYFTTEPTERDLRSINYTITKQLDMDRITRMDTKTVYDGTRIESENEEFGL